jgi:hypothetical protein
VSNTVSEIPIFFIVGRERSGTTLLQTLLNAHPEITVPIESRFIKYLYKRYRKQTDWNETTIKRFVKDLKTEPYQILWDLDQQQLIDQLMAVEQPSFANFCKVILQQKQTKKATLVGDKNPQYALFGPQLISVFPDAKFVWVIRDPRAQVHSMLKVNMEKKMVSSLAYRWKYFNRKMETFRQQHPKQVLQVRYEDLVADPKEQLLTICSFLNIEYTDSMLENRLQSIAENPFYSHTDHESVKQEISSKKEEEWRTFLTEKQIRVIEYLDGKPADTADYKPTVAPANVWVKLGTIPGKIYGRLLFTYLNLLFALPFSWRLFIFRKFIMPRFQFWKEGKERAEVDRQ